MSSRRNTQLYKRLNEFLSKPHLRHQRFAYCVCARARALNRCILMKHLTVANYYEPTVIAIRQFHKSDQDSNGSREKERNRELLSYSALADALSSASGNLRTYSGISTARNGRASSPLSFLSFSLSLFIVSSRGELVFHRAAIYSRGVHNCPR